MNEKAKRRLRILTALCSRVVAVGDEVRAFLLNEVHLAASKVDLIHNGVDVGRSRSLAQRSRAALGLPAEGHLIGHVGRLEPEKDQETLLRAGQIVLAEGTNVYLVIVGDGSMRAELEALATSLGIGERVCFLGLRKDVGDLLPHFDVFVLSSVREGLPFAVLEAMACERPLVATMVGDVSRLVQNGVTGWLVPPRDPRAIADAVTALLDCPERAAAMGQAARQLVEQHFSLTSTIAGYQNLYDSLLRNRTPPPSSAFNAEVPLP